MLALGGIYTQPRAILAINPWSRITVAELDPRVTETARERLFLDTADLRVVHSDARRVPAGESGPFDVVVGDVFHDLAIPFHLVTPEFAALVRERPAPDGALHRERGGRFPGPAAGPDAGQDLRTEFRHVDVWRDGVSESERVTFILTASDGGRLPLAVAARSGFQRSRYRVTEKIEALGGGPAGLPLLTDDYAPVERLTAGLLLEGAAESGRAAPPAKDNINNASNLEAEP